MATLQWKVNSNCIPSHTCGCPYDSKRQNPPSSIAGICLVGFILASSCAKGVSPRCSPAADQGGCDTIDNAMTSFYLLPNLWSSLRMEYALPLIATWLRDILEMWIFRIVWVSAWALELVSRRPFFQWRALNEFRYFPPILFAYFRDTIIVNDSS